MIRSVTAQELYGKFENTIVARGGGAWVLGVFEGSPVGDSYSWCSDCRAASEDLRAFLTEYKGEVKVVQFKVGTQDEWEGPDGWRNPFKSKFPFLSDLPTAVLFRGRMETAKLIQPKKNDLAYLAGRASVFEAQVQSGTWHPPKQT